MDIDIRNNPPPVDWGVEVSPAAVNDLAEDWKDREFALPAWDYPGLPRGLADADWYNFCVIGCSVLACIWPPKGDAMWTTRFAGEVLDDAPAIFSCFSRRLRANRLDLDIFTQLTPEEFFAGTGTLQLLPERWKQLNAVANALRTEWGGSAARLVAAGRFDAEQVVRLLVDTVPGFNDAPDSPAGRLPFHKLARLATAMMSAGGTRPFNRLERLPVYPDYMLPRVFRHFGIMRYETGLAAAIDSQTLIEKESRWELAIRWATVYCGDQLADALRKKGVAVTTPALDFALWESAVLGPHAAAMGEHHRTLTLAY
ncbi:MAG: queuosine salvage family protein [Acidimicrobiia bacterium]|nr:queuosine salvage family protein [Acidimicrobiia bacterium]